MKGTDILLFILILCLSAVCLLMCIPDEVLIGRRIPATPTPAFRAPVAERYVHLRESAE